MKNKKSASITAKVVGPIIDTSVPGASWQVRLKAARFPFYLDSEMHYATKEEAEREAEKWRKRTVVITVTK